MAADRGVSSLVLSELYEAGDAAFVPMLVTHRRDFKPLLGLVERWKNDRRPWAQQCKIEFLLRNDFPNQSRVVFKRIFKQAMATGDAAVAAACMVAVDRSIRRKRVFRYRYERVSAVRGSRLSKIIRTETLRVPTRASKPFSTATKHYLRRRAWRFFRRLGFSDGPAYLSGIAKALIYYTDDDVRTGENLLDNWGLMHACFGKSPELAFNARHTNLSPTRDLSGLVAAPMFERHWKTSATPLLDVLLAAQCRTVRVWAIQLLRRHHADALRRIDAETLLKLLDHRDTDVAAFAAELLNDASTVSSFSMDTWMALLNTANPAVVAAICLAFSRHVNPDRVTLAQAVELATRPAVPVATLGLDLLQTRPIRSDGDLRLLGRLSTARAAAVVDRITAYAIARLNVAGAYRVDEVVGFFDSRLPTMRAAAFAGLADGSPAEVDPALWSRLFESPYDDVRSELVARLKKRVTLPGATTRTLAFLWQTVLLNVYRGGRLKLTAVRQVGDRIVNDPASAGALLPVLAVAIRSVRGPEARHGLAAIVSAVERNPALAVEVRRQLPELQLVAR